MKHERTELVRPTLELESAYLSLLEDFNRYPPPAGFGIKHIEPDQFPAYLAKTQAQERGEGLPEGFVPQTTFWLVRDGDYVIGEIRLRHKLTPSLEHLGGHIGYAIRPSERRKGYGTLMLHLVLKEAKKLGLKRVLLTCDPDNLASARVMLKNGARQGADGIHPESGKPQSRYWIAL